MSIDARLAFKATLTRMPNNRLLTIMGNQTEQAILARAEALRRGIA